MNEESMVLTRKDFQSKVDPRWCPGCGCHHIFQKLLTTFPTLGIPRENFAIISGIGCSSRLPYYANVYGIHGIHGRAPTLAMGLKLSRPELSVWVVTGDGDGLAIGGNHFIHLMRRNADIKVILFNNRIYGLTKGQASPTTVKGTKTKTTPFGSEESPMRPLSMAIAAGATFAARVSDTDGELLSEVFQAAGRHKGTAFIEVLINCVIFNDQTFKALTDKETRAENTVRLKDGAPLLFGTEKNKGITINKLKPEVITVPQGSINPNVMVHEVSNPDSTPAYLLSLMDYPTHPVPLGIFRKVSMPVFGEKDGDRRIPTTEETEAMFRSGGSSWTVDSNGEIKANED